MAHPGDCMQTERWREYPKKLCGGSPEGMLQMAVQELGGSNPNTWCDDLNPPDAGEG